MAGFNFPCRMVCLMWMERGEARCACKRMLRDLALVIFCVVAALEQVGPSMARAGAPAPMLLERGLADPMLVSSPVKNDDCGGAVNCCSFVCAPCYLPFRPQYSEAVAVLPGPQPLTSRQDCLRSTILGRDPPIPRNHSL